MNSPLPAVMAALWVMLPAASSKTWPLTDRLLDTWMPAPANVKVKSSSFWLEPSVTVGSAAVALML